MKLKRWKPQTKRLSRAAALACADAEALAYLDTQHHYSAQTAELARQEAEGAASAIEAARVRLKTITDELDKRRRAIAAGARTLAEQRTQCDALAKHQNAASADVGRRKHARDAAEWHAIYRAALTDSLGAECERRRRAAAAGVAPGSHAKAPRQRRPAAAARGESRRDA